MAGNILQSLLYLTGGGLTGMAALPGTVPSTLYAYVPKRMGRVFGGVARTVSETAIESQGLQPGVEGKVWATRMAPEDFNSTAIGGSWGADWITKFPFLKFFKKNFQDGYVIKIKNTSTFSASGTYWKALLGQYESSAPIPAADIEVVPTSQAAGSGT